jgi:acyl-CoA thioester hydrolase
LFTHTTRVRFADTDMMGHVNNAVFSTYLEDARVAFFTAATRDLVGHPGLILAQSEVDFVAPIRFPGAVQTVLRVEHIGTKSFRLGYLLTQDGRVVARAVTVLVGYDYTANASRPLGDDERAALATHLEET